MSNSYQPKIDVESTFIITGILVVIFTVILAIVFIAPSPLPERKPLVIKAPDAKKVGESVGKTTGRFGRGFFKGLIHSDDNTK